MKRISYLCVFLALLSARAESVEPETARILVTFVQGESGYQSSSFQPPYRARKQYAVSPTIRAAARSIARKYALTEIDHWPLKSLSIYCYVFEVDEAHVDSVIRDLAGDPRIESVQRMNLFETQSGGAVDYDDEFLPMQHSLTTAGVLNAHRVSRGKGVRVAVVDSDADDQHEDLRGAVVRSRHVSLSTGQRDRVHGTAVASVIGARANNASGIVGVAPDVTLEISEACWRDASSERTVCDTFSLAMALDSLAASPPTVVNISLAGPDDPLLQRIIERLISEGTIVVAAWPGPVERAHNFPGSMPAVIAVAVTGGSAPALREVVHAPGEQILVAVPSNDYEFQSGSSLAAAHVTGIVALMKALSPDLDLGEVRSRLIGSQSDTSDGSVVVNACRALRYADAEIVCN